MRPDLLFFLYVVVLLGGMAAAGIYHERRRKLFQPAPSRDRIFRCGQCGFVYTDDPDVDRSRCPQCGTVNSEFQF